MEVLVATLFRMEWVHGYSLQGITEHLLLKRIKVDQGLLCESLGGLAGSGLLVSL